MYVLKSFRKVPHLLCHLLHTHIERVRMCASCVPTSVIYLINNTIYTENTIFSILRMSFARCSKNKNVCEPTNKRFPCTQTLSSISPTLCYHFLLLHLVRMRITYLRYKRVPSHTLTHTCHIYAGTLIVFINSFRVRK